MPRQGQTWTIALAGGNGVRLAEYVEQRFGERIPKQYCRLLGQRSMLEHTLDRLHKQTPAAQTLTVIAPDHTAWATSQLAGRSDHVFRQPSSRETGTALYVALAMLQRWSPDAIVTVSPTDHFVAPAQRYLAEVERARNVARRHPDHVVLIGAMPTEPDPELGYVSVAPTGDGFASVTAFIEKPAPSRAACLIRQGAVWNTMVCCGRVSAFWELGRAARPDLVDCLEHLIPRINTADEDAALEETYARTPVVGFSNDILARAPDRLLAIGLEGVEWNDWGRADRIEATITRRSARAATTGKRVSGLA